jgi:phage-related protein
MPSIYNIPTWNSSVTYRKNEAVIYFNKFFYSLIDNNLNEPPAFNSIYWGGVVSYNGKERPNFFWTPSYNAAVNQEPIVKTIKFGDGYEQRIPDGIHNNLIKIDLSFDKRETYETAAIIHFLTLRKGSEAFVFSLPEPYTSSRLVICRNWSNNYNFSNNYNIKATFEEVVN